jgi:hypothetical protein
VARGVQRIDNVSLDLRNGQRQLTVFGKVGEVVGRACGRGGVGVGRRDGEGTAEEDGCATVVHEDDGPETHAQLAFVVAEDGLFGAGVHLGGWVMVQSELDPEPDEAADETP